MSWLQNWFIPNNENIRDYNPTVIDEQIILQNHAYNMNAINMAHQEKMNAINKKYEEEKKMCETYYNQNMSKIDLNNDSNKYYYYQSNPNLYPNQNCELKIGNVGIIDNNINANLSNKNFININLSPEEKRKIEYEEREKKRKQRELERKRREAKNIKLTEEDILKKENK